MELVIDGQAPFAPGQSRTPPSAARRFQIRGRFAAGRTSPVRGAQLRTRRAQVRRRLRPRGRLTLLRRAGFPPGGPSNRPRRQARAASPRTASRAAGASSVPCCACRSCSYPATVGAARAERAGFSGAAAESAAGSPAARPGLRVRPAPVTRKSAAPGFGLRSRRGLQARPRAAARSRPAGKGAPACTARLSAVAGQRRARMSVASDPRAEPKFRTG